MKYKFNVPMDFFSAKIVIPLLLLVCWSSMVASSQGVLCSCYAFHNQKKTWTESEMYCRSKGGHLLSMETEEEWSLINSEIQNRTLADNEWYVGLFNNTVGWKWISHYNLTYDKWQSNEPSFSHNSELENCVIMAKNYSADQKGRFNNVRCRENKAFICEYKQGHGQDVRHCDILEPKYCWNSTAESAGSSQITIIVKGTDPNPTLVYVVIVLGILLAAGFGFYFYAFYCKKSNTEYRQDNSKWRLKYRGSTESEEDSAPSQAELLAETNVQDEGNQIDSEIERPEPQEHAQVSVENSSDQKYMISGPSSTSTYAALYSSVAVEEKKPEESEDPTAPKKPFPYHKVSEEPVVYAMVDKSKKAKEGNSQVEVEVVYAKVDKSHKNNT